MLDPNNLPPAGGLSKIITETHKDERGDTTLVVFARGDTGLIIGAVNGAAAMWGLGTSQTVIHFIDTPSAVLYVKECCREYLDREDVDFLSRDGDMIRHNPNQPQPRRPM